MRTILASLLVLSLSACSATIPFVIDCSGKGAITASGHGTAGSGVNASEMNALSLTADCGGDPSKGFHFERTSTPLPPQPKQGTQGTQP